MLERIGAQLLVLPCNTAHHFVQGVREATAIPFVSIVEATARAAAQRVAHSGRPVAVFATEGNVRAEVPEMDLDWDSQSNHSRAAPYVLDILVGDSHAGADIGKVMFPATS